jgi:hypothetical protein
MQVERVARSIRQEYSTLGLAEHSAENIVTDSAKRVLHSLLLACVMFAQQGMATHALSHLKSVGDDRIQVTDPAAPTDSFCAQCLAFQGVGSGLAGSDALAAAVDPVAASISGPIGEFVPFLGAPFSSRAPPYFLR